VFDVDEVLITPIDPFFHIFHGGSILDNFWIRYYYIFSTGDVFYKNIVKHYENALFTTKFKLVEQQTPGLIKKLQSQGVKVIALTACPTGMHEIVGMIEDWRIKHLLSFGIDFRGAFPEHNNVLFPAVVGFNPKLSQKRLPLFKDGILFTNRDTAKGPLLTAFLKKVGWQPKEIFFFDDGAKQVRSVRDAGKMLKIKTTSLQYLAADRFAKSVGRLAIKQRIQSIIEQGRWISSFEIN